jgi:hypothetical protein
MAGHSLGPILATTANIGRYSLQPILALNYDLDLRKTYVALNPKP